MLDQEFTFQDQNSSSFFLFFYCHSFISFIIFTIISHRNILEDLDYDSIAVYVLSFHCYNLGIHFFFFFCQSSRWLTNTFTTMQKEKKKKKKKSRRNVRWRVSIVDSLTDHFTWQMLSYSHMHLVQMFQLKVHTSSMTGSLPRGISTNIGYLGHVWSCTTPGQTETSQSVCIQEKKKEKKNYIYDFLKCIQLNSHKYINSQYLPVLVGFVVGPHPTIVNLLLAQ